MRAGSASDPARLRQFIDREARNVGFDAVRVTTPDAIPQAGKRLGSAVAAGHHGSMAWMAETAARRGDPRALWPEARSVIMLAMNYGPDSDPLELLERRDRAAISVYARNRDYHDVIKGRLKELAGKFAARSGADVKIFVDTAPVMENSAPGCSWARSSRRSSCRPIRAKRTIAARAAPASTPARRTPFPRPTGSMPGAASPT